MNLNRLKWETVIPKQNQVALALIKELNEELRNRYPSSSVHELNLDKIDNKNGIFIVASSEQKPLACGAISKLENGVGEIKRVYVRKEARRKGIAKLMMAKLEAEAIKLGFEQLKLETGDRQPESLGLYALLGYKKIPNFGEYLGDPHSICMAKDLNEFFIIVSNLGHNAN